MLHPIEHVTHAVYAESPFEFDGYLASYRCEPTRTGRIRKETRAFARKVAREKFGEGLIVEQIKGTPTRVLATVTA